MYEVPTQFAYRLHHVRPRFKNAAEDVLLFMANEISRISSSEREVFNAELDAAIRLYPGNYSRTQKTIANWRTEISSLFGLVETDKDICSPSRMAILLSQNQDLIEFFRYFMYYFQYPGGFLKPEKAAEMITMGVKFRPAKYIIQVLIEAQELEGSGKKFGISKAEVTHCIFNDLRVTRDGQSPRETAKLVLQNRKSQVAYDNSGDVIRYAGDILDYLELADLMRCGADQKYYLNSANIEILKAFTESDSWFAGYDHLYQQAEILAVDVAEARDAWFAYVNHELSSSIFEANVLSIIEQLENHANQSEPENSGSITELLGRIQANAKNGDGQSSHEIGHVGESIVIEHERKRLSALGFEDKLHWIQKIPEKFAVGFDIQSLEGTGEKRRYIEVKTTASVNPVFAKNFSMTASEWSAAATHGDSYFIYRLSISAVNISLFLIKNPVLKYKENLLEMRPQAAVTISYSDSSGTGEELLS